MWAAASAAVDAPGVDRELARQDVVDHLAALAEGGLDEPPQLVLGLRVEAVVGGVRLDDDDRGFDRRLRLEGGGRDPERDPDPGVVLHEDRQVAHPAGRRGDPLGDLALDHQHEPLRPRRCAEQGVQDRAGDVVRQVGDDVVRRLDELDEVLVERVALDEAERVDALEPLAQERRQARDRARPR